MQQPTSQYPRSYAVSERVCVRLCWYQGVHAVFTMHHDTTTVDDITYTECFECVSVAFTYYYGTSVLWF